MKIDVAVERWPLSTPFHITGHVFTDLDLVVVTLSQSGETGRGEAAGVYYLGDVSGPIVRQIENVRSRIEAGISHDSLETLLPPGGARNALDCALHDLEAKLRRQPAWHSCGLREPRGLRTTFGCGAASPEAMAEAALAYVQAKAIKLKLTGDPIDSDRVRAVRTARPDVWLGIDANQGFTREFLEKMMPVFVDQGVSLIEQPFRVGEEHLLDGFSSPIPIAADESAQTKFDLNRLVGRFDIVNIKLDKCGGLSHALQMAHLCQKLGFGLMVGNMLGTSLAMAPAYLLGQLCEVVDLDGPIFLSSDRPNSVSYDDGLITCPRAVWGYPSEP